MVHFQATSKKETMADTVEYFINHVVRLHGIPRSIVCDRDTKFLGNLWQAVMDRLGIKIRMTSGFHPQANGQAERTNQTLRQYLRAFFMQGENWTQCLATAEMAYNNAPIARSKYTPYLLNLGYHPCVIPDVHWDIQRPDIACEPAKIFVERMETQWTQAKAVLDQIKESSTKYANRNRQPSQFRVGQQVLVRMFPTNRDQLNAKGPLAKRWAGPYKIVKQITHDSFFLELGDTVGPKFQRVFNAINLKPYWRRIENKPEVIDVDADESETESVVSSQADDFQDVDPNASPFQVDPAETEFQFPDSLPTPLTNQEK